MLMTIFQKIQKTNTTQIINSRMVLLHYKKTDHNQFLINVDGNSLVGEVVQQLVQINNMRIKLDIFSCSLEELATHGPIKPEQIRGLNDPQLIQNALIVSSPDKKLWGIPRKPQNDQRYNQDKTHYRIGIIKNQHITNMMIQTSNRAKKLLAAKNVEQRLLLTMKLLQEAFDQLIAAVTIAYPNLEGLGEWEPIRHICEKRYVWEDINTDRIDYYSPKNTTLWWAGKEFLPEKALNTYCGKNEKTKLLVKLTKVGSGAPAREPAIDEETRIKLMSMYHRKQEEMKKIQSKNQEDFTHSVWANPNNLKNHIINGGKDIKFKGLK